jgi:hypothetical protein
LKHLNILPVFLELLYLHLYCMLSFQLSSKLKVTYFSNHFNT